MLVCLERAFAQIIHYVPYKDRDASAKLSAYNQPLFKKKKKLEQSLYPSLHVEQGSGSHHEHHTAQPSV